MNTMASSLLHHKSFYDWSDFLTQSPKAISRIGATLLLICFSLNTYAAIKTWKGTTSSNWNVASNWNPAAVPVAGDDVNLSGAIPPNMPKILSGTLARAGSVYIGFNLVLTIESGGELEIEGTQFASLDVAGILDNFGILRIKRADFHCIDNVGTITNNHIILLGQATSSPYTCKEEGIRNNGSGQFINNSTGQLTIQRTGNNGILQFTGSPLFRNYGQITVREAGFNPATANTADGIDVRAGNFINETNGNILISKIQANGFFCRESGSTTNKGVLTIRNTGLTTAEEVKEGLSNNTFFENTATGQISIDSTGNNGIFSQGVFTNGGQISVGTLAANSITTNGIANIGQFTNKTGATLTIKNTGRSGLTHLSFGGLFLNESGANISVNNTTLDGFLTFGFGSVENRGTIQIGNTGPIGTIGVLNNCTFVNQPGATLTIQQTTGVGILNEKTTPSVPVFFKNGGQLTIGNPASAGSAVAGIQNLTPCSFENLFCGQITTYQKIVNEGTFLNDAFIKLLGTAANSNSGTFTNNGLIEDPNGLFNGVTLTNNDFIVVPATGECLISNVLRKGAGANVTIGSTWYKASNLTQPAGSYNQAANTFSVTNLAFGVHTLYFLATDNETGCTQTVPIRVTFGDSTPPTAICKNVTVFLNETGNGSTTAAAVDNGSSDICGIATISLSKTNFNCSNLGSNNVTLTVTDNSGNSSTCSAIVTVQDNILPTIICPATQTLVLGANCSANLPDYRSMGATGDNCGVASVAQSPAPGTTVSNSGNITVTLTVTDVNGNNANCSFTVTKVDTTPPTISCPANQMLVLGATCSATLPDYRSMATTGDNCGVASVAQSPAPGTTVSNSGNLTITLTVTDINGNNTNCTFTVTKVDNTAPTITCPGTQTLTLGAACSASLPDYSSMAVTADNCGVANVAQSPAPGTIVSNSGDVTVTLTVTDVNGNSANCSFKVTKVDNTPPTVVCFPQTLTFNGEENFELQTEDLVDASDNCGIATISLSPAVITCDQLGQTIPYTTTVTDVNGNVTTCTNNITVTGLPCGWSQTPDGVNCTDGSNISYHVPTQVFTVASTNCYYSNPFTVDEMAFTQYQLCGNGSITAQVTGISASALGWAGVILRESNDAGAKKVQLTTNMNSNQSRREVRYTTNGSAYPQQFLGQGRFWLRLVRQGSQFIGYASSNGVNWFQVMAVTVSMNSCIEAGLVLSNFLQNSTVTATFANVLITGGGNNLASAPDGTAVGVGANDDLPRPLPDFNVFPNPTNGAINIDLSAYTDRAGTVKVFDAYGKLVMQNQLDGSAFFLMKLDDADGVYFLSIELEDEAPVTKRVVIAH